MSYKQSCESYNDSGYLNADESKQKPSQMRLQPRVILVPQYGAGSTASAGDVGQCGQQGHGYSMVSEAYPNATGAFNYSAN